VAVQVSPTRVGAILAGERDLPSGQVRNKGQIYMLTCIKGGVDSVKLSLKALEGVVTLPFTKDKSAQLDKEFIVLNKVKREAKREGGEGGNKE